MATTADLTVGQPCAGTPTVTYNNGTAGVGATLTIAAAGGNWTGTAPTIEGGITPVVGDRVLVKNQTNALQNGIYTITTIGTAGTATSAVLTRATDANTAALLSPGTFVFTEVGSQADTGWVMNADSPITMGTSNITWTKFSASADITDGDGLTKVGNAFNVNVVANRTAITSDAVDIASTYVGQTSITTLGTIATGTWAATTIGIGRGGTGSTNEPDARWKLAKTATAGTVSWQPGELATRYYVNCPVIAPVGGIITWTIPLPGTDTTMVDGIMVQMRQLNGNVVEVDIDTAATSGSNAAVVLSWNSSTSTTSSQYQAVIVY